MLTNQQELCVTYYYWNMHSNTLPFSCHSKNTIVNCLVNQDTQAYYTKKRFGIWIWSDSRNKVREKGKRKRQKRKRGEREMRKWRKERENGEKRKIEGKKR